ncbi:hypothetical protein Nepgr_022871 [Nepenthes gracilis]|uniref:Uncharacterized protein n=1 Tax=Nepenthes gracilis TaxID=150966 RepID=A0AAD3XYH7_NEPGR|nr:hypothetical protein Nepgr_022871 [Nepenthes gracilis]
MALVAKGGTWSCFEDMLCCISDMIVLDVDAEFSGRACILLPWKLLVGCGCQGRYVCSSILIGFAGSRSSGVGALDCSDELLSCLLLMLVPAEVADVFSCMLDTLHCAVCGCVMLSLFGVLLLMFQFPTVEDEPNVSSEYQNPVQSDPVSGGGPENPPCCAVSSHELENVVDPSTKSLIENSVVGGYSRGDSVPPSIPDSKISAPSLAEPVPLILRPVGLSPSPATDTTDTPLQCQTPTPDPLEVGSHRALLKNPPSPGTSNTGAGAYSKKGEQTNVFALGVVGCMHLAIYVTRYGLPISRTDVMDDLDEPSGPTPSPGFFAFRSGSCCFAIVIYGPSLLIAWPMACRRGLLVDGVSSLDNHCFSAGCQDSGLWGLNVVLEDAVYGSWKLGAVVTSAFEWC